MKESAHFKNVEKVLASFPEDVQQNYYKNKESLIIKFVEDLSSGSIDSYNYRDNIIELASKNVLEHELFHMAFSDRKNFLKEIEPGVYLGNGVSYIINGKEYGVGLTEGLVESLVKKAGIEVISREFQCYIVDLLSLIYGNEIYLFPLRNDPIGFYSYFSNNIFIIENCLDLYTDLLSFSGDVFEKFINNELNIEKFNYFFNSYIRFIPFSIIECIRGVVGEYNSCSFPKITRLEFKNKLENILFTEEFLVNIKLSEQIGLDLRHEIDEIINNELMIKGYIK